MKKNYFKNIFLKKLIFPDYFKTKVYPSDCIRDWKILVLIFAVGLFCLSAFAWKIYLSDKIGGGYLASDTEFIVSIEKTLDEKKLQTDLEMLRVKQSDFLKFEINRYKSVDPSL